MAIIGQAVFTSAHISRLRTEDRYSNGTGLYISEDFGGSGFNDNGNEVYSGAETFLNEEEGSGYANRWDWFDTAIPVDAPGGGTAQQYEAVPANSPAGISSNAVDYIHYAAILAKIWDGQTDSVTFSGETKTKDLHALDLSRAVFDVLVQQSGESGLDFGNTTRFPRGDSEIGNPFFVYAAKMEKYMNSYSLIYDQISGDSYYQSNFAAVESWFSDAKDFFKDRAEELNDEVFGARLPEDINATSTASANSFYKGVRDHTHYDVSGNEDGYDNSWAARSGLANRNFDLIAMITQYGILFNDSDCRDFGWGMYQLFFKLSVYPDGTYQELARSQSGSDDLRSNGLVYWNINNFHLVSMAHSHAVAVENGLTGVSDKGKYYDYTTSDGSDELYTSGYLGSSTSGGTKGLKLVLLAYAKMYKNAADGGWRDTRYGPEAGYLHNNDRRPYTVNHAIANMYYDDSDLEDFYKGNSPYVGLPRYYGDGDSPAVINVGPGRPFSLQTSWGKTGALLGGFAGSGDMEGHVFVSGAIPVITLTGESIVNLTVGDTYTELGATWSDSEDGSGAATVGGDTVNTSVEGTYVVTYDHTDTDSNVATQVTRTVNVNAVPILDSLINLKIGSNKGSIVYIGGTKLDFD